MTGLNLNAPLYAQSLSYNAASAPYQCLTLPWWVRTGEHAVYPPRHGCSLEPLICGENLFDRIAADVLNARASVDIVTWGFDPGMKLRCASGNDDARYGEILKQVASRTDHPVKVRLLLWHDDGLAHHHAKNNPGYFGLRMPSIGGYAGFFSEEHDRYNRKWFDDAKSNLLPNIEFHVRKLSLPVALAALAGEKYISSSSGLAESLYATHHQKMLLIDYELPYRAIGYVMGHNSTADFWDTVEHRYQDPRRETLYKRNPAELSSQFDNAMQVPGPPTTRKSGRARRCRVPTQKKHGLLVCLLSIALPPSRITMFRCGYGGQSCLT